MEATLAEGGEVEETGKNMLVNVKHPGVRIKGGKLMARSPGYQMHTKFSQRLCSFVDSCDF